MSYPDDARLGWIAAAVMLAGCSPDSGTTSVTGLSTQQVTMLTNNDEGDDGDGDSTSAPPTGGSESSGTTDDPPTSETTADASTSETSAGTSTSETSAGTSTTEVCAPGTAGCPCDAGACDGDLVCADDVCVSANCGDGNVDPDEECDDAADNGPGQACLGDCVLNACGDGDKGPGEGCDAGADNDDAGMCTSACAPATCGDGLVWAGQEACDDGAQNGDTKACLSTCEENVCGDGFLLNGAEQCDDGAQNGNTKACLSSCVDNVCGDGFVLAGVEQCDDGNDAINDGCTPLCKTESMTESISVDGLGLQIPDNGYNGTQASMACVDLQALKSIIVTNVTVTMAVEHPWIGDLVVKLYSPDAKVLALMSRPGLAEVSDNGTGAAGDSSDLKQAFPIEFRDGGATNAESMGGSIGETAAACEADALCVYYPNKGAATGLNNFAGFDGIQAKGMWRLCVGDSLSDDAGTLEAVTLEINLP